MIGVDQARVDVVIVTWNKFELSLECIEHALQSTIPINVIVVDNASSDETVAEISSRFPEVTLIELSENIGFGPGFNKGLAACKAEFVGVLNSDANVEPEFFERALAAFDGAGHAVVGGLALNPHNHTIDSAGGIIDGGLGWFQFGSGEQIDEVDLGDERLVGPCWVAAVARRSALQDVGGFDEEIFAYWEDVDLTLRLLSEGYTISVEPTARAWHIGSATLGQRTAGQLRLASWGRGYVSGRYRVGAGWLALEVLIGIVDSIRLREIAPLGMRVKGWRHGRSMPRRPVPSGIHFVTFADSLRMRFKWFSGR